MTKTLLCNTVDMVLKENEKNLFLFSEHFFLKGETTWVFFSGLSALQREVKVIIKLHKCKK